MRQTPPFRGEFWQDPSLAALVKEIPLPVAMPKVLRLNPTLIVSVAPLIPLPDPSFAVKSPLYQPVSVSNRLALFPLTWRGNSLGVGAELFLPFWTYAASDASQFLMQFHIVGVQANVIYNFALLGGRFAVDLRLGGGFSVFGNVSSDNSDEDILLPEATTFQPVASGSAAFQWYMVESVFSEISLQYNYYFLRDKFSLTYIRPSLSLGMRI
jgi:hypothetical protein